MSPTHSTLASSKNKDRREKLSSKIVGEVRMLYCIFDTSIIEAMPPDHEVTISHFVSRGFPLGIATTHQVGYFTMLLTRSLDR